MTDSRFDVTTLGEVMLRLSVPAGQRLETARQFEAHPAGAEANVVSALSRLGRPCAWVGALPDTSLGRLVANHLRMAGLDLNGIIWSQEHRLGTYFLEFAVPPRPIQVIYDRANSCAANLQPDQINWEHLLNSRLIHLTGITPALSTGCSSIVSTVIERARQAGVALSFDINYRQKLWAPEQAKATLTPLIRDIDLLLCAQADARRIFGFTGSAEQIVKALAGYSGARSVVVTLGEQGVIGWDGDQYHRAEALPVTVVDRIGAGDGLAAGVIHGWLDGDLTQGLRYGVALAALALSQHGDMIITTPEELLSLLDNTGGGVRR